MTTKVLLVGGGAREHAIAQAVTDSPDAPVLFAALSNRNPGILRLAREHLLVKETRVDEIVKWAVERGVELALIGPEAPLEAGLTDALTAAGVRVAAPSQAAARIETDKAWMRDLMARHDIPGRIPHVVATSEEDARRAIESFGGRVALKPIGLTGGKGVQVHGDHFRDTEGALRYVREVITQRVGGAAAIIVEEKQEGEEFTLQAFSDGTRLLPTPAVQDHKRLLPNDEGPNTGGMGAYSQGDHLLPFLTQREYEEALQILQGIVDALRAEGHAYRGPIYGQFIITPAGPRVIEVNARFGDPEAMNVLAVLDADFLGIAQGMAAGDLSRARVRYHERATVVKYIVPAGYGSQPKSGVPIRIDHEALAAAGARLYYAAVNEDNGALHTTTSRAVAVLGMGDTLAEANETCEEGLRAVAAEGLFVRHDIGTKELIERRIEHMRTLRSAP